MTVTHTAAPDRHHTTTGAQLVSQPSGATHPAADPATGRPSRTGVAGKPPGRGPLDRASDAPHAAQARSRVTGGPASGTDGASKPGPDPRPPTTTTALNAYIEQVVAAAPPLTHTQLERLSVLLQRPDRDLARRTG